MEDEKEEVGKIELIIKQRGKNIRKNIKNSFVFMNNIHTKADIMVLVKYTRRVCGYT